MHFVEGLLRLVLRSVYDPTRFNSRGPAWGPLPDKNFWAELQCVCIILSPSFLSLIARTTKEIVLID